MASRPDLHAIEHHTATAHASLLTGAFPALLEKTHGVIAGLEDVIGEAAEIDGEGALVDGRLGGGWQGDGEAEEGGKDDGDLHDAGGLVVFGLVM